MEEKTYDDLFASEFRRGTDQVTILTGQGTLVKGSVLGKITATGKYKLVDDAAVDGSEDPKNVLSVETDTSGGDVINTVYTTGDFNENKLVFGGDDTADDHREAMHDRSLFMAKAVPA